jgi:cytochrome c2
MIAVTLCLVLQTVSQSQERGSRGEAPTSPLPQVISSRPPVDPVAHDRGREVWAKQCIDCHGTQARGSDNGPNLIRSTIVNRDRSSFTPGSVLGLFLKSGHPTQSGTPSSTFTEDQVIGLAHFLRQRVNDTMRGSALFVPGDVLTGDAKAGEAYFRGEGGCAACHNATSRNLAGIRSRFANTVDLQQRMLFPMPAGGRGAAQNVPGPNDITVTISQSTGPTFSGVLVEQDSFFLRFRDASGVIQTVRRTPGMKVVITNPFQAHIELLDRLTDKNIHDLVAYLETLK